MFPYAAFISQCTNYYQQLTKAKVNLYQIIMKHVIQVIKLIWYKYI